MSVVVRRNCAYVPIRSQPGKSFIVDVEDLDIAKRRSWFITPAGLAAKFKYKVFNLHRLIYEKHFGSITKNQWVIHIDGDKLNNRKSNLRLFNRSNALHRRETNNASGVQGVDVKHTYYARIRVNNKSVDLGYYKQLGNAAIASNIAALMVYHDQAKLNQYRLAPLSTEYKERFEDLKEKFRRKLEQAGMETSQLLLSSDELLERITATS